MLTDERPVNPFESPANCDSQSSSRRRMLPAVLRTGGRILFCLAFIPLGASVYRTTVATWSTVAAGDPSPAISNNLIVVGILFTVSGGVCLAAAARIAGPPRDD